MSVPLSVVYDFSQLAGGTGEAMSRTGLFRVVSSVARGLARRPDCDLWLAAGESFDALDACLEYVRSDSRLSSVPLLVPPALPLRRHLFRTLVSLQQVSDSSVLRGHVRAGQFRSAWRELHLPQRLLRRSATYAARLIGLESLPRRWPAGLRPDVYHSPYGPLPAITRGTTRVLTIYDLIPVVAPQYCTAAQRVFLTTVLASLTRDDWVVSISQHTKDVFCEYARFDPQRVFVTHIAADRTLFHPCVDLFRHSATRRRYGIPPGPYFLSLGTLEPRKNIPHLIRCFGRLVGEGHLRKASLVLVGARGWMSDDITKALAEHNELRGRIVITGYVADEDLAALYSGALAFVYPSLEEGFGLPLLEAMQCGTPVIASNAAALPEVVGDAGILVPPRDEEELCEAMRRVFSDATLRSELRKRSLARASQFTWDQCVDATVAAYRTALAAGRKSRPSRTRSQGPPARPTAADQRQTTSGPHAAAGVELSS